MDMMPPQAPPALTQPAHQDAAATVSRLSEAHAWISAQEAAMPKPSAASSAVSPEAYLASLTAFWQSPVVTSPGADPVPRWAAFGVRMAGVMADEASLRQHDGTLSESAARIARAFAGSVGGALPHGVHARELDFGYVAYAGAVVVTDDNEGAMALLFTPARGWDEFPTVEALHEFVETMAREESQSPGALPGILQDDFENVAGRHFVSSSDIEGPAFPSLVSRITEVQRERITEAWAGDTHADADLLTQASRLYPHLDLAAIMQARNTRLAGKLHQERLASVPTDTRENWLAARAAYAGQLEWSERARVQTKLGMPTSLSEHTVNRLGEKLRALGITSDPRDITVDIYPMPTLGTPGAVLDALANGVEPPETGLIESVTLVDLALRNVGFLDRHTFRALDKDGNRLAPALTHARIKSLVREVDIGGSYRDVMVRELATSPEGELRRGLATTLQRERMRFEAADARVGSLQPSSENTFADDRKERGFNWVRVALDSPAQQGREKVEGHDVVVSQLTYHDEPVSGVLVFGVRSQGSVASVVLYTPDAPDGRAFREFGSRADAARGFLHDPAFEAYLLDRLPDNLSVMATNGSGRHFKLSHGERLANWVFGQGDQVRTVEAFSERAIDGDFFEASYLAALSLASTNLASVARSTDHADADSVSPRIDPEAVARSIAHLIGRPFAAGWQAYDKARMGDHAGAFVDLAQAYVTSLDFTIAGALKPALTRSIAVRSAAGSARLVPAGKPLRDTYGAFDDRFIASGVSIRDARSVSDGVYSIKGRRYIEKDGRLYGVRRDGDAWRLTHGDSATYAPFVMREANGTWTHLGLRGGLQPGGSHRGALRHALRDDRPRLTPWQLTVATHTLVRSEGLAGTLAIATALRDGGRAGLNAAQLTALNAALLRARGAPRHRPFVPAAELPVPPALPVGQPVAAAAIAPGLHPQYRELHGEVLSALTRTGLTEWQQRIVIDQLVASAGLQEARAIGARIASRSDLGNVTLTMRQMEIWNDAMTVAHRSRAGVPPALPGVAPLPPPVPMVIQPLDIVDWPDQVWRDVSSVRQDVLRRASSLQFTFSGPQIRDWSGRRGFPTVIETPPGASAPGVAPPGWMRIDLHALRQRLLRSGDPAALTLTRVADDQGVRYLLGARDPNGLIELLTGEFQFGPLGASADNAVAGPSWAFNPPR